jgi:catechol 2,3-dioxygenase-like lactoylglutathione lyase family enzyme
MTTAIDGFHHVKLPVTDVHRSRDWYQRVLGLTTRLEFVEEETLMGVALQDESHSLELALRQDPSRAKSMSGFDPIAVAVPTTDLLESWREKLDTLGEPHGGIIRGHAGQVLVGLHDPDGIEIRFYTESAPA